LTVNPTPVVDIWLGHAKEDTVERLKARLSVYEKLLETKATTFHFDPEQQPLFDAAMTMCGVGNLDREAALIDALTVAFAAKTHGGVH